MYLRFFNPSKVYSRKQLESMRDDVKKTLADLKAIEPQLAADELMVEATNEYKMLAVNTQRALDTLLEAQ